MNKGRIYKYVYILLALVIVSFSVAYSALSTSLYINGSTKYRAKKNIRVTGVTLTGVTGGGVEQYNPSYTYNTVTLGTSFSSSGTVTYRVEITNYSTDEYNISCTINSNNTYTVTNNFTNPVGEGVYTLDVTITGSNGQDNATGTISFTPCSKKLYDVLKFAAQEGTYAKLYTGSHQDSMDSSKSTEDIYYWYGSDNTNGTAILDMNNVIFAGHCWQMIRTTDTGGVKLVYNGEPENNQCLSTRGTHIGYSSRTTTSLNTSYYYGTDYTFDGTSFTLSGTITTGTINTGEYTCKQTTSSGTCTTLYYVDVLSSGATYYVLPITTGKPYSQFGGLQFNQNRTSPADVGYMYNTRYTYNSLTRIDESTLPTFSLKTTYYYADSFTYDSVNNKYTLVNPYLVSSTDDYPNLAGKYTFMNTTSNVTASYVYYIADVYSSNMAYIQMTNGNPLSYYNYTYSFGSSYTDNGNGTYTINNPTTINRIDWYKNYSSVTKGKYVCKNAVNNTCSDVWLVLDSSKVSFYYYSSVTNNYKYSTGFTYNANTSTYTLNNSSVTFWDTKENVNNFANYHYTCFNTTGECTSISYIYYYYSGYYQPYYIDLSSGKSVEDALDEMLSASNVNTYSSTIKTGIDAWYKHYLLGYDVFIEDTIYCNDRSIRTLNGWNSNGGSVTSYLQFKEYNSTTDLNCTNTTDKFSVSNTSAQLTYKVGLLSNPETSLLNNGNIRKTGQYYWLASPYNFSYNNADGIYVNSSTGAMGSNNVYYALGVRPSVSLISGIEYSEGDGSMANPYIVDVSPRSVTNMSKSDTGVIGTQHASDYNGQAVNWNATYEKLNEGFALVAFVHDITNADNDGPILVSTIEGATHYTGATSTTSSFEYRGQTWYGTWGSSYHHGVYYATTTDYPIYSKNSTSTATYVDIAKQMIDSYYLEAYGSSYTESAVSGISTTSVERIATFRWAGSDANITSYWEKVNSGFAIVGINDRPIRDGRSMIMVSTNSSAVTLTRGSYSNLAYVHSFTYLGKTWYVSDVYTPSMAKDYYSASTSYTNTTYMATEGQDNRLLETAAKKLINKYILG